MASNTKLDLNTVMDGLGHGILIFDNDGKLTTDNLASRTLLGKDLELIRKDGWDAASTLFNATQTNPEKTIESIRDAAYRSEKPVRFYTLLNGEYVPCWAAAIQGEGGEMHLMITIDMPDWSTITNLLDRFRSEMEDAIQSTQGHIDLITQTIKHNEGGTVEQLAKRITGFTRLISIHMARVGRLMEMLKRMEEIRTGEIRDNARKRRKKIDIENYLEDFIEELDEISIVDPETDAQDHRSRLTVEGASGVYVAASSHYLTRILHEILRNAIMYSMKATPLKITVTAKDKLVQFDITDEGYGIRDSEQDRVFNAFERALQPQIMGEFGYGLSLYLCKHEVEAMNGQLWFQSEETVGTTFSFTLPAWQDEAAASSSSSDSDAT